MNAHLDQLVPLSRLALESLLRASLEGGLALLLVWLLCRTAPRLPGRAKCWLWRLAYLKLLLALFWTTPVQLPFLRARPLAVEPALALPAPPTLETPGADQVAPELPTLARQSRQLSRADRLALAIVSIWLIGALAMLIRLAARWIAARLMLQSCARLSDDSLVRATQELSASAGLRSALRLRIGTRIGSPLLVGALQPVILLPPGIQDLPGSQLRLILAHEIAHAARRDIAWRIFAALIESLFFFHPILWLCRRESNLAQELAADQMAMELTQATALDYGGTLLSIAARGTPPLLSLATPIVTSPRTLERRLIAMRNPIHWSNRHLIITASVVAFVAAVTLPRWRLVAQEAGRATEAPAARQQTTEVPRLTEAPATRTTADRPAARGLMLRGVLRAGKKVQIQARADGFIQSIDAKDGDVVKPGQALVALDDTTQKLHVVAASIEYKAKRVEADRRQEAHAQHVVSNSEMEQLLLEADVAQTKLQLAQQELSLMHIAAPIGGVIEFDRAHSAGEYVARGTTLATILDQGDARLEMQLPETMRQQVRAGMAVEATTEAYPGEHFTGRIAFISAEADAPTGLIRAAADIANPKQLPLSGLMARVTIALPTAKEGADR